MKRIASMLLLAMVLLCFFGCKAKKQEESTSKNAPEASSTTESNQQSYAEAVDTLTSAFNDYMDLLGADDDWDDWDFNGGDDDITFGDVLDSINSTFNPNVSIGAPITVQFGDFDAMQKVSKTAQNNQYAEGQIIVIDGELSVNFGNAAIGEKSDDGEFVGTTLEVEGWEEDDYPEDGSRVLVTATCKANKDYFFIYLTAKPSDVTVLAAPEVEYLDFSDYDWDEEDIIDF